MDHNRFFQLNGKKIHCQWIVSESYNKCPFYHFPFSWLLEHWAKSQVTLLSKQHHCGWLCDPDLFTLQGLLFPNGKIRNIQFIFKLPSSQVTQMVKKKKKEKKKSACNSGATGGVGSISGSGQSPEGGHDKPLQFSCLENSLDRGAWWATGHGVTESQTCLETNTFTFTSDSETMEINIQVMGQIIFLHLLSSYHFLSRSLSWR